MHEFPFALGTNFSLALSLALSLPLFHSQAAHLATICMGGGAEYFRFRAAFAPSLPLPLSLSVLKDIFHMCRTHAQPLGYPPSSAVAATVFRHCLLKCKCKQHTN